MTLLPVPVDAASPSILPSQVGAVLDAMDIAESSRRQYEREIGVFLRWLGTAPLTPVTLVAFKKHLKARTDIAVGTKAKYLAVARAFLRTLYRLGVIPVDVTVGVKGFKVTRAHKRRPIQDQEIARVFEFLQADDADPRARVIIHLMFYQGLRRVEVCRLRVEDFDRDAKTLTVLGKGKDDCESIDLHPRTVDALSKYLKSENLKSGPLFPSRQRPGCGLSSSMVWRLAMQGVHQKLGLGERSLHGYRKAFTTRLIRSGMPLLDVMGYTRHASVQMLRTYYDRMEREKTIPIFIAALDG